MLQSNNDDPPGPSTPMDKPHSPVWARLRKRLRNDGQTVHRGLLEGASTKLGSGAVTLIILWMQSRH